MEQAVVNRKPVNSGVDEVARLLKALVPAPTAPASAAASEPRLQKSPQVKRRSPEESVELVETTNRCFTNELRKGIKELANKEKDPGQTIGHYSSRYPEHINRLKKNLVKYVPIGKTFEQSWKSASAAIYQERSVAKKGRNDEQV